MSQGSAGGIAAYYDNLSGFLDFARWFGRGGGAAQGATHRFLAGDAGEEAAPERLDLLVLEAALAAGLPAEPRVLDAGCGIGGTIFRWRERVHGTYDGLTLSPEQCRRAEAEATRRGVAAHCRFHLQSYQDPIAGSYDAAIAIESLAHSPDPTIAVANLAAALAPGGLLLIVDDMPVSRAAPDMLAAFKAGWRCPVLADAGTFRTILAQAGLELRSEENLTSRLRPRTLLTLKALITVFGLARRFAPTPGLRDVLDALRGGFLLEALYRKGAMTYRLIVAAKPLSHKSTP
jgi:SAM-dependent methyltransferase